MQFSGVTMTGGYSVLTGAAPAGDQYWANVSLLMNTTSTNAQTNNTFLDSSTNNFSMTRVGSATQGSFTPFTVANGSSYSTATNGGSAYFPGTSYLTAPASTNFAFGTGDFTMECWVRFSSTSGFIPLMQSDSALSSTSDKIWLGLNSNVLTLGQHATANAATTAWTPSTNTWYHVAAVRQSGTVKLFINGVQQAVTNSTIFTSTSFGQNGFGVGVVSTPVYLTGYMSSVRVVKGTAVYTASFTPSTTPLTAISGTSLLLNFTNAGMYDAAAKNNMLSTGTAQASTTQAKWSPTSAYFNGISASLQIPSSAILYPTMSDDFTAEMWAYPDTSQSLAILMGFNSSTVLAPWVLRITSSTLEVTLGNISITQGTVTVGQWNHIAFTKSGSTVRLFLNGVQQGSNATVSSITVGGMNFTIGDWSNGGRPFNGYIQDVRITKGVARYTSNFSVPTAAFPTSA